MRLSDVAGRPGGRVEIEISLATPSDREPQAVQWETTIAADRLAFVEDRPRVGPAAEAADKSFACSVKMASPATRTMVCVLAGGLKVIPSGLLARLQLRILPDAPPGTAAVRTSRGLAVLPGLKSVPLPSAETSVTIRPGADKQAPPKQKKQ